MVFHHLVVWDLAPRENEGPKSDTVINTVIQRLEKLDPKTIDYTDSAGLTALNYACEYGYLGVVETLLKLGASDTGCSEILQWSIENRTDSVFSTIYGVMYK